MQPDDEASDPERLRAAQAAAFEAEDLGRFFGLSRRLAEVSPGYAGSYEWWVQTTLHALARREPGPCFLQVGGMDGKRFDPIYAFVKHYGWKGVILEPLADLFAELARNYAGNGVTLVNAALTDEDGERAMLRVRRQAVQDGAVPVWAEGLASFYPERNALGGVGVSPELRATLLGNAQHETVACVTFRTLAERYDLPRIDLLQVDAEGCELEIVRQVEASAYRPAVVQLEHWALPVGERGELLGILGRQGYILRMGESDVIALQPDLYAAVSAEAGFPC
jgi:FkbM family methyltransferase